MTISLRPAGPDDAAAVAQLGHDSFVAAFGHLYRPEDLNGFLATAYTTEKVTGEIADPAYLHCLAVDEDGALGGFCKMSAPSCFAEHSDAARPIALHQLYCDPASIGRGIGAQLMDWALGEARARGHDAVQLSVWAENFGAQRFYQRYGFGKIADIDFWVGSHRDDELLYELRL